MLDIIFVLFILLGFCGLVTIGALVAWLCGFELNEPEYYEYRKELKQWKTMKLLIIPKSGIVVDQLNNSQAIKHLQNKRPKGGYKA